MRFDGCCGFSVLSGYILCSLEVYMSVFIGICVWVWFCAMEEGSVDEYMSRESYPEAVCFR